MKDGEYKTVARYTDAVSAHIAEGMLLENGIPAVVFGEVSSYPSLNVMDSIELKVFEADYDAAMALLAAPATDDTPDDTPDVTPDVTPDDTPDVILSEAKDLEAE